MSEAGRMIEAPDAGEDVFGSWLHHVRRGDFHLAWKVSDAVLGARAGVSCAHEPRHLQYIWDGSALTGRRVLVRCYHGLGDTIQFIRYAPLVKAVAKEVIVWAQPSLLPLLRTARGIDQLLPLHDGTPDVDYDVDVEIMELPHVFRSTLASLPATVPYLHAKPAKLASAPADARNFNVGLIWQSGDWDDRRSVPVSLLTPLARIPGVTVHILQRGPALAEWPRELGAQSGSDRVEELARVMRALDLVITVDSMPAHLAGALGVSTWTLLHADPDWRWLMNRDDSPWYPTMRLFRQARAGDWTDVVARVQKELREISAEHALG
jgi:hypothetical protein